MHVKTSEDAEICLSLLTRLVFLYRSVLKVAEHDLETVGVQGMQDSNEHRENKTQFMLYLWPATKPVKLLPCVPHVFEPVDRQQVGGHGKVQLVDESGHFGRRIQQVDNGAAQVVKLGLKPREQRISLWTLRYVKRQTS